VIAFERRETIGGGCRTDEKIEGDYITLPGFRHNLHSIVHTFIHAGPVYDDLELEKYGARYVFPNAQATVLFPQENRSLTFFRDPGRTLKEIEKFSKRDARSYHDLLSQFGPLMKMLYGYFFSPPQGLGQQIAAMEQTQEGLEMIKVMNTTQQNIVEDYFESEQVRVALLAMGENNAVPATLHGGGMAIPYICCLLNSGLFGMCVGGSGQLTQAMGTVLKESGGAIAASCAVTKIIVEGRRAKGVILENGDMVLANKAVISNTSPQETFFDLVGEEHLEAAFVKKLQGIKPDHLVPFFNMVALDEPPDWKLAPKEPHIVESFVHYMTCNTVREFITSVHEVKEGKLPTKNLRLVTPTNSLLDQSLTPPGKYTSGGMTMVGPELEGGFKQWNDVKEWFSDLILEQFSHFAPNMAPGSPNILARHTRTPLDCAREMTGMFKGSWIGGSQSPDQMGLLRPYPSTRPYRTPFMGLYLCGMQNHPFGGVSGAPGYNAATVITEDFKIKKWWRPYVPTL
jgi:phytoene dehydrogenase-like protein